MVTGTQNGSGSPGLPHAPGDHVGRHAAESDPSEASSQQAQVLSLDQIQITRGANEYTEGPVAAPRPGSRASESSQPKAELESDPTDEHESQLVIEGRPQHQHHTHPLQANPAEFAGPVRIGVWTSTRTRDHSTSSERMLLESAPNDHVVRGQPELAELKPKALKATVGQGAGLHACRCAGCGRHVCETCTRPRTMPSCWLCGRRCLCSARNLVEYGTCICCIKGLFYHCSSDDEDICVDDPCSCSHSHCCVRWSVIGVMSLFLPCLLCYLPLKGCVKLCEACYSRAAQPRCRCKNASPALCKATEKPT
ncbi:protein sprouty2-like [Scleropages formosus]|uniref:Protein sprouty homolog 2 n=1 Tax=Scleropages formosus TaxID=113540 RepID=A0A0N8JWK1_SCLFO|nr:protein sprouty homolog 2-like [Scleropages formosus]KPP61161.1 protein sprouty2-like [Scleropages formosus]